VHPCCSLPCRYLQQTDEGLLGFGEGEDGEEDIEIEDDDEEEEEEEAGGKAQAKADKVKDKKQSQKEKKAQEVRAARRQAHAGSAGGAQMNTWSRQQGRADVWSGGCMCVA
jgi:hypothetical protein